MSSLLLLSFHSATRSSCSRAPVSRLSRPRRHDHPTAPALILHVRSLATDDAPPPPPPTDDDPPPPPTDDEPPPPPPPPDAAEFTRQALERIRHRLAAQAAANTIAPNFFTTLAARPGNTESPSDSSEEAPRKEVDTTTRAMQMEMKWASYAIYQQLNNEIEAKKNRPHRVWSLYNELCEQLGPQEVTMRLHRRVLPMCVPSLARTFAAASRARGLGRKYDKRAHLLEQRLRVVLWRMRASGFRPAHCDYHFVLKYLGAGGRFRIASTVLQEMENEGVMPDANSYWLMLRSLCIRQPDGARTHVAEAAEAAGVATEVLGAMWDKGIPCEPVILDRLARLLKEADVEVAEYEEYLALAYGVDLSNPDRLASQFQERVARRAAQADPTAPPLQPPGFSTNVLNTTVAFFGRAQELWKMVQAFEVLSTPLPRPPPTPQSNAFDDDDDDFPSTYGNFLEHPSGADARHARPNRTTFAYLIRWSALERHDLLARHYFVQAIAEEKRTHAEFARALAEDPGVPEHPHVSVDAYMVYDMFEMLNKERNMELMRWLMKATERLVRDKTAELELLQRIQLETAGPAHLRAGAMALQEMEEPAPPEPDGLFLPEEEDEEDSKDADAFLREDSVTEISEEGDEGPPHLGAGAMALQEIQEPAPPEPDRLHFPEKDDDSEDTAGTDAFDLQDSVTETSEEGEEPSQPTPSRPDRSAVNDARARASLLMQHMRRLSRDIDAIAKITVEKMEPAVKRIKAAWDEEKKKRKAERAVAKAAKAGAKAEKESKSGKAAKKDDTPPDDSLWAGVNSTQDGSQEDTKAVGVA